MFVQACINGARPRDFHTNLPLTAEAMAADARAVLAAGARELHVHPRANLKESLLAVDETVAQIRTACPGVPVGVSTGGWIEDDVVRTRQAIMDWQVLPEYASVNLSEPDAPEVMRLLRQRGVGIEAGLATLDDVERLLGLDIPVDDRAITRILIEIDDQDWNLARSQALEIAARLSAAGAHAPILLHGIDATVWNLVELAAHKGWSTRVGLEDGKHLPNGKIAADNAALVAAAVTIFRSAI